MMSTLMRSGAILLIGSPLSIDGISSGSIVILAKEPAASPLTMFPGLMQMTPSIYFANSLSWPGVMRMSGVTPAGNIIFWYCSHSIGVAWLPGYSG